MLCDFENDSEVDLEDLEARLYGQIYHSTSEDLNSEGKTIPDSIMNTEQNSKKRKSGRYFENADLSITPQAYQPHRFLNLGNQRMNNHALPTNYCNNLQPNNLEHMNCVQHQNIPHNEPSQYSQISPYPNGCQQFIYPGHPAINNIVVIPPSSTQIFTTPLVNTGRTNRNKEKKRIRNQRKRQRLRELSQQGDTSEGRQSVFREHRMQHRSKSNLENSNRNSDELFNCVIPCDSPRADVVILSDSDGSDIEEVIIKDSVIDISSDDDVLSNSFINNKPNEQSTPTILNQLSEEDINKNETEIKIEHFDEDDVTIIERKAKTTNSSIKVSDRSCNRKQESITYVDNDDVIIIEAYAEEHEVINIDDTKETDYSRKIVYEVVDEHNKVTEKGNRLKSKMLPHSSEANSEDIIFVNSPSISKTAENKTCKKGRREIGTPDSSSTNDFLETVDLSQDNFNFELYGNDFCYSKSANQKKNRSNESYETESSCSTSDCPIKSSTFNEIEFDAPSKDVFSEPNLESFANFITPKRKISKSTPIKAVTSKEKCDKRQTSDNVCEDSKYLQIEKLKKSNSEKQTGLSDTSSMLSDNDNAEDTPKKSKKKKRKTKAMSEDEILVESVQSEKDESSKKKKAKKRNKNINIEENASTVNVEFENEKEESVSIEDSLDSGTPKVKKKKKRKKEKSSEESLEDNLLEKEENTFDQVDNLDVLTDSSFNTSKVKKKNKKQKGKTAKISETEDELEKTAPENSIDFDSEIQKSDTSNFKGNVLQIYNENVIKESTKKDEMEIISSISSTEDSNKKIKVQENVSKEFTKSESDDDGSYCTLDITGDVDSNSELSFCTVIETDDSDAFRNNADSSSDDFLDFSDIGDDLEIINVQDDRKTYVHSNSTCMVNKRGFSSYWNEDMKKFYSESWGQENFSVKEIQMTMSDDPDMWKIDNLDRLRLQFPDSKSPRCRRCRQRGHQAQHCPNKSEVPVCSLCGAKGHSEPRCPNKICTACGERINFSTTYCSRCKGYRHVVCSICKMRGHPTKNCPDLWRRYHLTNCKFKETGNTMDKKPSKHQRSSEMNENVEHICQWTKEGPIICPEKEEMKAPNERWCSGCGSQGHFEYSCKYYNRTHAATLLSVQYYDPVYEPLKTSPKRKHMDHGDEDWSSTKTKHLKSVEIHEEEIRENYTHSKTKSQDGNYNQNSQCKSPSNSNVSTENFKINSVQSHNQMNNHNVGNNIIAGAFIAPENSYRENFHQRRETSPCLLAVPEQSRYFFNPWAIQTMFPINQAALFQNFSNPQMFNNYLQNRPSSSNFQSPFPPFQSLNPLAFNQNFLNGSNALYNDQQLMQRGSLSPQFFHQKGLNRSYQEHYPQSQGSKNADMPDVFYNDTMITNLNSTNEENPIIHGQDSCDRLESRVIKLDLEESKALTSIYGRELLHNLTNAIGIKFRLNNQKDLFILGRISDKMMKIVEQRVYDFLQQYSEKMGLLGLPKTHFYAVQWLKNEFYSLSKEQNLSRYYKSLMMISRRLSRGISSIAKKELQFKRRSKYVAINRCLLGKFGLENGKKHVSILRKWLQENEKRQANYKLNESEWRMLNDSFVYVFQNDSSKFTSLEFLSKLEVPNVHRQLPNIIKKASNVLNTADDSLKERKTHEIIKKYLMHFQRRCKKQTRRGKKRSVKHK